MTDRHWVLCVIRDLQELAQHSSLELVAEALGRAYEVAETELDKPPQRVQLKDVKLTELKAENVVCFREHRTPQ